MDRSLEPAEWKPQATTGQHWKGGHSATARGPAGEVLDLELVERAGFSRTLTEAAMHADLDHYQIADRIHISHGYMCKFMRGVGEQWARRLVAFMRVTNSIAPLVWLADQMGCDVVVRHKVSAELAAAYAVIEQHERRHGRLLT